MPVLYVILWVMYVSLSFESRIRLESSKFISVVCGVVIIEDRGGSAGRFYCKYVSVHMFAWTFCGYSTRFLPVWFVTAISITDR